MATKKSVEAKSRYRTYRNNKVFVTLFFLLSLGYLLLTFVPPPDPQALNHYSLSVTNYRWLVAPIVIFLILIWIAALVGSLKIRHYAVVIAGSRDGEAFRLLSRGFLLLALMMPLVSDTGALVNVTSRYHTGYREPLTIIANYLNLAVMAGAMWFVWRGACRLMSLVSDRQKSIREEFWMLTFISFSSIYGYFLVGHPDSLIGGRRTYYLPRWLTLLSIAIPYLFSWYLGLRGAYNIQRYQNNVRGQLYKQALRYLAAGVALVVLSSVIIRTFTTLAAQINHLGLTPVLLIVYGLLVVIAAGYILIALGAKKLRRLEEV